MYKIDVMVNGAIIKKDLDLLDCLEPTQNLNEWNIIAKFKNGMQGYYMSFNKLFKSINEELCNRFIDDIMEGYNLFLKAYEQKEIRKILKKTFLDYPKNKKDLLVKEKKIKALKTQLTDYNIYNKTLLRRMHLLHNRFIKNIDKE